MSDRLAPILAARRARLTQEKAAHPLRERERAAAAAAPVRGLRAALAPAPLAIIAEIKRRSPSAGDIGPGADAAALAIAYAAAGARALSVLTEPDFFNGSAADLEAARAATTLPILRKDFIVDPYQIVESRALGADAVLLIVAALGRDVGTFLERARTLDLDALIEVHDEAELDIALAAGADLIGINNRNLVDLSVDLATTERLCAHVPPGVVVVSESGVEGAADAHRLARAGADALLVGTALMRAPDSAALLARLVA